jgi:hypothetical protein
MLNRTSQVGISHLFLNRLKHLLNTHLIAFPLWH